MPALAELDDNAAVMLVSGTRPQGDETTFATANSQTVISVLRLYDSNAEGDNPPLRVSSAISWSPKSSSKYASFSMPCLQAYEDRNPFDCETNSCAIGTCLVSTASTAEDLVKPDATRGLMSLFFEHRRDEAPVVLTKYARIPVRGVTKLVLSPIAFDSTLESCVGAEKPSYRVMALARVEGLFSKPFTLCELEHPVDFVVSLTSSGTTATLLASTIIPARTRPRAVRGSL